jgi:hypothetical protein
LGTFSGVGAYPPKPPPLVEPQRNPSGLRFFLSFLPGILLGHPINLRARPRYLLRCLAGGERVSESVTRAGIFMADFLISDTLSHA